MKLSIVIPVYNVEKYVGRCLESCINQGLSSKLYEIIVVNDGSTDNSMLVVNELIGKYPNIRILNQKNQGLSGARNSGLDVALGEYVWFVDSDDWIENCLSNILPLLDGTVDLLQIQYQFVYEDGSVTVPPPCLINGIKSGREVTLSGGVETPATFSIYRTSFLKCNNLKFCLGIYHEDTEFKPRAVMLAKNIASTHQICYNYFQRSQGSITSTFRLKNGLDLLIVMNHLSDFASKYDKAIKYSINLKIASCINSLLLGMRNLSSEEKCVLIERIKINRHLFIAMMQTSNTKFRFEGLVLWLNFRLGMVLHQMIR